MTTFEMVAVAVVAVPALLFLVGCTVTLITFIVCMFRR